MFLLPLGMGWSTDQRPGSSLVSSLVMQTHQPPVSENTQVCTLKFEKLCSTLQKFISFTVGSALQNHDILEVQSRPSESPSWWKGVTVP